MRGTRLVVDAWLHALGWSRRRALEFVVAHVPMPEAFLANELDRHIVMPAQALSYVSESASSCACETTRAGGSARDSRASGFHAVVLDSGSLPMVVLDEKIRNWPGAGLTAS
jgi:uncharacterized protein (DUF885 family)